MRAVLDTNILVSGLLSGSGPPGRVLADVAAGRLQPVLCGDILAEYQTVLARPRLGIRPERAAEFLALIAQIADWVQVPAYAGNPPLPDPDDWPFIAAALAADCALITGNLKHVPGGLGVRVMTARPHALTHSRQASYTITIASVSSSQ